MRLGCEERWSDTEKPGGQSESLECYPEGINEPQSAHGTPWVPGKNFWGRGELTECVLGNTLRITVLGGK